MDKFICKHCNYALNIKKTTIDNMKKISSPNELIAAYKNDEQDIYEIVFERTILDNFLIKKNIKDAEKVKIVQFYNTILNQKKTGSKFMLKCSTCGSEYQLKPETIIYSLNFKKQRSSFDDEYIDIKLNDPTLPRTKDYLCPNKSCDTNKKTFDKSKKEAVIYRADDTYYTKYACTICKTSWLI